jgi:hypothetical protein
LTLAGAGTNVRPSSDGEDGGCGSPGWIRTSDHSINSRMLYR